MRGADRRLWLEGGLISDCGGLRAHRGACGGPREGVNAGSEIEDGPLARISRTLSTFVISSHCSIRRNACRALRQASSFAIAVLAAVFISTMRTGVSPDPACEFTP